MGAISVRLSDEDMKALNALRKSTGKSASELVREALHEKRRRSGRREKRRDTAFADACEAYWSLTADEPPGPPTNDASNVASRVRAMLGSKKRARRL